MRSRTTARVLGPIIAACALLPFLGIHNAEGRTWPGLAAQAIPSSNQSCLGVSYAAVTNNCTSAVTINVPLPIDSAGNKYVGWCLLEPAGSFGTSCDVFGVNADETTFWHQGVTGGFWPEPSNCGTHSISSGYTGAPPNYPTYVPSYGYLFLSCPLEPQNTLFSVTVTNP